MYVSECTGPGDGDRSCAMCPAGKYLTALTGGKCAPCTVAGSFCKSGSMLATTPCFAGFYCPTTATQVECPAGSSCPTGSTSATTCTTPGTYCPAGAKSATTPCTAGFHCPTTATQVKCSVGAYCPASALSETACPPGTTTSAEGSVYVIACNTCAAGFFGNAVNGTGCTPCGTGTYLAAPTDGTCTPCPLGTTTLAEGAVNVTACDTCAAGYYGNTVNGCTPCATGATTTGPGATELNDCYCSETGAGIYVSGTVQCRYAPCCALVAYVNTSGIYDFKKFLGRYATSASGTLPTAWGEFIDIEDVYLYGMSVEGGQLLIGTLPAAWSNMVALTRLDIGYNKITGTLPEAWSNMVSLTHLNMGANGLTGTLPEKRQCVEQHGRNIVGKGLIGTLPAAWSNMGVLESLTLSSNALTGTLPESWGNLDALTTLDIASNSGLHGPVPAGITPVDNTYTRCYGTSLTGCGQAYNCAPGYYGNVVDGCKRCPTGATTLGFGATELNDCYCVETGAGIYVQGTAQCPDDVCCVRVLYVEAAGANTYKNLSGRYAFVDHKLPEAWGEFIFMKDIFLNAQNLIGTLPAAWSNMSALEFLDLGGNALNGTLPSVWSNMGALMRLELRDNVLTGTLPMMWGNMDSLVYQDLHSNSGLSGPVPTGIAPADTLCYGTSITGCSSYSASTCSARFYDDANNGCTPCAVGAITTGSGATESNDCYCVETGTGIYVGGTAQCPDGPCCARVTYISDSGDTDFNKLLGRYVTSVDGTLPAAWGAFIYAKDILLTSQGFIGTLPAAWSSMGALSALVLGGNTLTGILPEVWSNMASLTRIYLSSNALTGTLPSVWGTMDALEQLALVSNALNGTIPQAWGGMDTLSFMNLGFNSGLHGVVPDGITPADNTDTLCYGTTITGCFSYSESTCSARQYDAAGNGCTPCPDGATTTGSGAIKLNDCYCVEEGESIYIGGTALCPFGLCCVRLTYISSSGEMNFHRFAGRYTTSVDGTLPAAWGELIYVTSISVSTQRFIVTLPAAWSNMGALEILLLYSNSLIGTLPEAWSNMDAWRVLHLHFNVLEGTLPETWSNMDALQWLDLQSNSLTGTLPKSWGNMDSLNRLHLQSNTGLNGSVPAGITPADNTRTICYNTFITGCSSYDANGW
ncbi:hypothetical protein FOA52_008872 [Chlamydomonas sp. UWO 241]|nr:hypothetical protein FOA52_008872 [Chlamydomonas sp. UWO 241]